MDANVVAALAPSDPSVAERVAIPLLPIARDEHGKIAALRDEVELLIGGIDTRLVFRPLRQLLVGNAKAPDLSQGPTPELEPLFVLLEHTVVRFCDADGRDATDQEMEQIFPRSFDDGQTRRGDPSGRTFVQPRSFTRPCAT